MPRSPELSADAESVSVDPDNPQAPSMVQSTAPSRASAFSLTRSRLVYNELDERTIALDQMLYNILRLNVKGIKYELLSSVLFHSYVHGMTVLYKHMKINRTDRKNRAFNAADKLNFDGDVQSFQIKATAMI